MGKQITRDDLERVNFPYYYNLISIGNLKISYVVDRLFNGNRKRYYRYRDAYLGLTKYRKKEKDERTKKEIERIKYNYNNGLYPTEGPQYGIIYKVTCIYTGRVYIGKTINSFNKRYKGGFFKQHSDNKLLIKDLKKYGEDSFEIEKIIDVAYSPSHLDDLEIYYIDYYNSYEKGYNKTRGDFNFLRVFNLINE